MSEKNDLKRLQDAAEYLENTMFECCKVIGGERYVALPLLYGSLSTITSIAFNGDLVNERTCHVIRNEVEMINGIYTVVWNCSECSFPVSIAASYCPNCGCKVVTE